MRVVDLFSGCGGLSLGFIQNGHRIVKAVEYDKDIAKIYSMNHPAVDLIIDDIKNIDKSEIFCAGDADVVIGGPPCQGFSMAGARIRDGFIDDPRNYLFKHYFNVVKAIKPKVFIMENVKGILTMHQGSIYKEIQNSFHNTELLNGDTYQIYTYLVNAKDFGIPQKRERVIMIGTRLKNIDIDDLWDVVKNEISSENPTFFKLVTIKDAIGNLPKATENGIILNPLPITDYQVYLSTLKKQITNHKQTKHSKVAVKRMEKIREGENFTALNEQITSVHSGSYGRLSWEEQAPTITTRFDTPAGGRFIHPVENRTLTPREAARIQSFPDDFEFIGNKTIICKTIGNAVPPKISYFLARLVDKMIKMGSE